MTDEDRRPSTPQGAPSRTALTLVVVPLVALVIASNVGNYTGVWLVNQNPLLLIVLTSQIKWLVGAVNQLEPTVFFTVGLLRNLAPDPLFYLLGFWYGDSAVRWMENRTQTLGDLLRSLERSFPKWGRPLVFIAPNNPICLLAGAARMPVAEFAVLNVTGTISRLILIKILGETFERPIDWVLNFLAEYRVPLLIISLGIGAFTMWRETRQGTSEIQQLRQLEHELDNDTDGPSGP